MIMVEYLWLWLRREAVAIVWNVWVGEQSKANNIHRESLWLRRASRTEDLCGCLWLAVDNNIMWLAGWLACAGWADDEVDGDVDISNGQEDNRNRKLITRKASCTPSFHTELSASTKQPFMFQQQQAAALLPHHTTIWYHPLRHPPSIQYSNSSYPYHILPLSQPSIQYS
jgi:hypothetical protein